MIANIVYTIIIYPLTQIIEFVFVFSQKIFKETAISVILISCTISIFCLPLYVVAEKWQELERNIQKKLKPQIDIIKSVFRGDEQYMILSTYYKQNHYHPVYSLRSALGLLIQIPFFIAAYSYLSHLDALKGAQFLFLSDLGSPDALLNIGSVSINILPILMTAINCVSSAIYTKGFSLKERVQLYAMALLFLVLLYNSPSGLVLYWTMNNIFSLIKNSYYKINLPFKNKLLFSIISLLCLGMIYYMLGIHKGAASQRKLIALAFGIIGVIPWIFYLLKGKIQVNVLNFTNYDKKFTIVLLSALVLWILTGVCIPSMLIGSSPQEFSYIDKYTTPLFFIYNTALQALGFFIFWPLCLYSIFPQKIKLLFSFLGPALCFAAMINTFVFPGNYGLITINLQFAHNPSHSLYETGINILALCFIFLVILFLFIKKVHKTIIPAVSLCCISLLGLSCINFSTINTEYHKMSEFHIDAGEEITSLQSIFHLSKTGKNTVVIMLDRASSSFFPFILEESPDLNERYSGFVYYPNTVAFNGYTRIGAPPIFGGYEYTPSEINKRDTETMVSKHNQSLLMLPRIFSEAGYSIVVTDPPYPNYSYAEDLRIYEEYPGVKAYITDAAYTAFWLKENNIKLPSISDILKRDIFWYSLFRAAPLPFRWGIYQWGDWCAPVSGQKLSSLLNGYSVLDYLPRLTDFAAQTENTVLLMVSNATHEGALLQAPEYRPALNITAYGQGRFNKETEYHINIAAFKRLADWFDFLKDNDIYDNTRIILVSDHGSQISYVTKGKTGLPENFDNLHPILLVKDFNASGNMETDMTFMSTADVPSLVLEGQIDNPINPFTGNKISMEAKKSPLYIANSGAIHLGSPTLTQLTLIPERDYYVHDDIFNPTNWNKVK
ncbi:membrane protein [Spirochaetia bacterium]|nr:membrane protein [Spirochaetia bacterium]